MADLGLQLHYFIAGDLFAVLPGQGVHDEGNGEEGDGLQLVGSSQRLAHVRGEGSVQRAALPGGRRREADFAWIHTQCRHTGEEELIDVGVRCWPRSRLP